MRKKMKNLPQQYDNWRGPPGGAGGLGRGAGGFGGPGGGGGGGGGLFGGMISLYRSHYSMISAFKIFFCLSTNADLGHLKKRKISTLTN